jgi:hypothetical protein
MRGGRRPWHHRAVLRSARPRSDARRRRWLLPAIALIGVALIAGCGSDDDEPSASAEATTAATTTTATRPATALPASVPGYEITALGPGAYRESLIFRMRNAILNGVSGTASAYALQTAQAQRGGETALVIGVRTAPGAAPVPVPADIRRLLVAPPDQTLRMSGLRADVYRTSGTDVVLVAVSEDQAAIAMAADRASAIDLARALAQGSAEA